MKWDRGKGKNFLLGIQLFFYLSSVLLWFKDNFSYLRDSKIPFMAAAGPLLLITFISLVLRIRSRGFRINLKPERKTLIILIIILLITAVRIPYLASHFGLMDSDEAIPALMGKHIAEGKRPPLFYYGAFFQGSFPSHLSGVMYKIFGYSNFMTKFFAHILFILFLIFLYLFVKEIFSFDVACAVLLFYGLPFRHGMIAGFDVGSGFPVVFLFGILILFLTHKICFARRKNLVPVLAFIMGLAFWTHQISVIFILTAAVYLIGHFKLQIKRYLEMFIFFCCGCFPVILNEIFERFTLFQFLKGGDEGAGSLLERLQVAYRFLLSLLSPDIKTFHHVFPFLLLFGWILLMISLYRKKTRPRSIFAVFFLFFSVIYLASDFSAMHVIRYHYILYTAIPVILGSLFLQLKPRLRFPAITALFLLLFFLTGWKDGTAYLKSVQSNHRQRKQTLQDMLETGKKYWMGEYWTSYLFNALSKENITAASYSVERYYPYKLRYENSGETENWIFQMDEPEQAHKASRLLALLDKTNVPYSSRRSSEYLLVYDIQGEIYSRTFQAPLPQDSPSISLSGASSSGKDLKLHFKRETISPESYRLQVNIKDSIIRSVPLPGRTYFTVDVPIPETSSFFVRFHLDYMGLPATPVFQEKPDVLPIKPAEKRRKIDYLSGFGPRRNREGRSLLVCAKTASCRCNQAVEPGTKLILCLYSPIPFSHPFWYGKYCQTVSFYVNDNKLTELPLRDGKNVVSVPCVYDCFRKEGSIITLQFKYVLVHSSRDLWKTAAFLQDISFTTQSGEK
ncbi:MAG: hypothetical protein JXB26_17370 [Candidatus Aminicenantes bacterium]|nr:hypothetical protein [Candidatus Aminicenantes bacterium]